MPSLTAPITGTSSLVQGLQESSLVKSDMLLKREDLADYLLKLTGLSKQGPKTYCTRNFLSYSQKRKKYPQKELLPTPHTQLLFPPFVLNTPILQLCGEQGHQDRERKMTESIKKNSPSF